MKKILLPPCFMILFCLPLIGDAAPKQNTGMVIFENFEDASKHRVISKNAEISARFGFNGSAGLRLSPHGKQAQYELPLNFKPEKGKRYLLTIYEKKHGKVVSHIAWEAYKNSRHQFGNWNVNRTPLEGGWTKCELPVYIKTDDDVSGKDWKFRYLAIATAKDSAGKDAWVDYDNLSIREDVPVWHLANVWPTHNKLQAEDGKIRLYSAFDGSFLKPGAHPLYKLELLVDGQVIATQVLKDQNGVIRAAFGRQNRCGPAILRFSLLDAETSGTVVSRELEIRIAKRYLPKKGEIIIDEKGRAIIDGKPFMPLGFFTGFPGNKPEDAARHLKWMHDAGFNAVVEYLGDSWRGNIRTLLDMMQRNGIRMLYNFTSAVHHPEQIETKYRKRALEIKDHPAVIGWYIMDEAHAEQLPAIIRMRKMLNEMTPGQVTWSYNVFEVPPYLAAADMPGGGIYPVGQAPDLMSSDIKMRKAAACATGLWYAPQAMNWANYRKGAMDSEEAYRKAAPEPSAHELLAVALHQASHGVTGFFFYHYGDIWKGKVPEWIPKRLEAMRYIGQTMKSLEPFILSGEGITEIPHEDLKGKSRVVALTDGRGACRILVIGLQKDNECSFVPPEKYQVKNSYTGLSAWKNGKWFFRGKAFSCDILK